MANAKGHVKLIRALDNLERDWSDVKLSDLPDLIASFSDGDPKTHPLVARLRQMDPIWQEIRQIVDRLSGGALEPGNTQTHPSAPSDPQPPAAASTAPTSPASKRSSGRRPHDMALDFLLLDGLRRTELFGRVIGLADLYELSNAYEPATKRTSHNAKLNRWKNDEELVQWVDARDISLTPAGVAKRNDLLRFVRETTKARLLDAYKTAWGIEPRIE